MSSPRGGHAQPPGPDLETRVLELEDIEAIKQLKYTYARLCDAGYDPTVGELFIEEGIWSSNRSGPHIGREAIVRHFSHAPSRYPWAVHMMINPEITVLGDSAQADWILLQVADHVQGDDSDGAAPKTNLVLAVGRYRDRLVRRHQNWKFAEMHLEAERVVDLERAPS